MLALEHSSINDLIVYNNEYWILVYLETAKTNPPNLLNFSQSFREIFSFAANHEERFTFLKLDRIMKTKIKLWMQKQLRYNPEYYLDSSNVLNATLLAEDAHRYFNPDEDDIPELFFEISHIVTEKETKLCGYNQ